MCSLRKRWLLTASDLNPTLSRSCEIEWWETSLEFVISHCKGLNHSSGGKWCISHTVMFHLAPSEKITCHSLGLELVLRAVYSLLYGVNVSCYTNQYLHSCISKWRNRTKSILSEETQWKRWQELLWASIGCTFGSCCFKIDFTIFISFAVTSHKSVPF